MLERFSTIKNSKSRPSFWWTFPRGSANSVRNATLWQFEPISGSSFKSSAHYWVAQRSGKMSNCWFAWKIKTGIFHTQAAGTLSWEGINVFPHLLASQKFMPSGSIPHPTPRVDSASSKPSWTQHVHHTHRCAPDTDGTTSSIKACFSSPTGPSSQLLAYIRIIWELVKHRFQGSSLWFFDSVKSWVGPLLP